MVTGQALFAQAGCLTDEQQKKAEAAVHDYTTALQKSLAEAGYYREEVDGVYGPSTVDAVKALQEKNGLPVTGAMDKATRPRCKRSWRPRAARPPSRPSPRPWRFSGH